MRRSVVLGTGGYLPERVVTNADLSRTIETSDEWIVQRTGIRERHIAGEDEKTSDLATHAARAALEMGGVAPGDIDLIVLATATPDNTFPATATKLQQNLGCRGAAFDVQAVCSGFVYALSVADNMLRLNQAQRALVVGAEVFSRILDWEDRTTCVLFADGAGAVVLEAQEGGGDSSDRGVLATNLYSDGAHYELLYVDGGPGSAGGTVGHLRMEGREVFRHAIVRMVEAVEASLADSGLEKKDINWLVPHQANIRIIDGVGKIIGLPSDHVVVTVGEQANTSAATIPLALDLAVRDGRIRQGDVVALTAMGGGFTWAGAVIRW